MQEEDTICYKLRRVNDIMERVALKGGATLEDFLEVKRLLAEATYSAAAMDRKLWEYKFKEERYLNDSPRDY